jgi:hypothetical protein
MFSAETGLTPAMKRMGLAAATTSGVEGDDGEGGQLKSRKSSLVRALQ